MLARMTAIVQLGAEEELAARPFTARRNTIRDERVMQSMLAQMRRLAPEWSERGATNGVLVKEADADGYRHWIRVPDRAALAAAARLTIVGFFGASRDGVDHAPIHDLEQAIVDTLEQVTGVLSYYDVELPQGGYGNLILCDDDDAPARVRGHELHRRAVELTPLHYRTVRLHTGVVAGGFVSDAELVVRRTRYYDFDDEPVWTATREIT